jgi:DNA mismatch endonuclease (patch repair protein)
MMQGRTPSASSHAAAKRMRSTRQRDTNAELAIRKCLHAMGLRYRVDHQPLTGLTRRADIVFSQARLAIFIDGCFWHCCPKHRTFPKANKLWWLRKLQANRSRDADTNRKLRAAGWAVMRIWEHEDAAGAASRIAERLGIS